MRYRIGMFWASRHFLLRGSLCACTEFVRSRGPETNSEEAIRPVFFTSTVAMTSVKRAWDRCLTWIEAFNALFPHTLVTAVC